MTREQVEGLKLKRLIQATLTTLEAHLETPSRDAARDVAHSRELRGQLESLELTITPKEKHD